MLPSVQQHAYFEPWLRYKHPLVRQLAFAVASPNLLQQIPAELDCKYAFELHPDQLWQQHFYSYQARLQALDQSPHELENFLRQLKSTRLGLRFEHLLWFWLQDNAYHPYQLLGHSIQKITGPKTLGELDFVLLNRDTQQIEHWEVALKYYLAEGDFTLAQWFGLNRNDTFSNKLHHFTQKQFQFSDALGYPIERRFAVIKGQLYLPYAVSGWHPQHAPKWINSQRRHGLWGNLIPPQDFYRLQRHEWLCPNAEASSQSAIWWTEGLYYQAATVQFYMYRRPALLLHK